jgi:hypothetical protein
VYERRAILATGHLGIMFRIFKEAKDAFLYSPPGTPSSAPPQRPAYSPRQSQSPAPVPASTSGTGAQGISSETRTGEAAARLKGTPGASRGDVAADFVIIEEKNDELDMVIQQLSELVDGSHEEYMRIIMVSHHLQSVWLVDC